MCRGTLRCVCWIFSILFIVLGVISIILALLGLLLTPKIIHDQILKEKKFGLDGKKPTDITKRWADPKYEMLFQIHVFAVLNADQILNNLTVTPLMDEKGPYSFKEFRHNEYKFSDDGQRVAYKTQTTYHFDPETSCPTCRLDDYVTVPNFPMQILERRAEENIMIAIGINAAITTVNATAFTKVQVGQLLFDGYEDPLLVELKREHNLTIPTHVGLMYGRNGSYGAPYTINTGSKNIDLISKVYNWNESTVTNAWYKPEARQVRGVDGCMFPPKRYGHIESFEVFTGDICRPVKFRHAKSVDYDDLPVEEYRVDSSMGDPEEEQRIGFCNPDSVRFFDNITIQPEYCAPTGLIELSSCHPEAEGFYFGQPRFFGSNDVLRHQVAGISKWNSEHRTIIRIEPQTGTVVHVQQYSQLNVGVISKALVPLMGLTPRIMPLIWINETIKYDKETSRQLHHLIDVQLILFGIETGLLVLGVLFIVIGAVIYCCQCCRTTGERQVVWVQVAQPQPADPTIPPLQLKDEAGQSP